MLKFKRNREVYDCTKLGSATRETRFTMEAILKENGAYLTAGFS